MIGTILRAIPAVPLISRQALNQLGKITPALLSGSLLFTPEGREVASEVAKAVGEQLGFAGKAVNDAAAEVAGKATAEIATEVVQKVVPNVVDGLVDQTSQAVVDASIERAIDGTESKRGYGKEALPWVGAVLVVGGLIAGTWYLLNDSNEPAAAVSDVPARPNAPNPDDDDNDNENSDSENPPRHFPSNKTPEIPRNVMKTLLAKYGKDIYKKFLEKREQPNFQGKIWGNQDFRVDAGHTVNGSGNRMKSWNLQVNRDAVWQAAKDLLKNSRGTHKKLFWDAFDILDPPSYETWVKAILDRFH